MALETTITGTWLAKHRLRIDEESLIYGDTQMMCADITGFAYGQLQLSHNFVRTSTDFNFKFIDSSNDEIEIIFIRSFIFNRDADTLNDRIISEIWRSFGNRLLKEFIEKISNNIPVKIGTVTFNRSGVSFLHEPLVGKNRVVQIPWDEITHEQFDGKLCISSAKEKWAKAHLYFKDDYNAHLVWQVIHMLPADNIFHQGVTIIS